MTSPAPTSTAPLLAYTNSSGVPGHWTNVSIHRLDPARFTGAVLRGLARGLLAFPLMILLEIAVHYAVTGTFEWSWTFARPVAIAMSASALLVPISLILQLRKVWKGLELIIADEGLLRRGGGLSTMEIPRAEITLMVVGRGISIRTRRYFKNIGVMPELEDFPEIRARLLGWAEIPSSRHTVAIFFKRQAWLFGLLALSIAGLILMLRGSWPWGANTGLALIILSNTGLTIRIAGARELPTSQRAAMLVAAWAMLPPLVTLAAMKLLLVRH